MKFYLTLFISVFFSLSVSSQQRPFFIISTTKVYATPATNGKAMGVYARGGSAEEIKKLSNGWSQVIVENGDTGFLPSKYLAHSLNAMDKYEKDPEDFVLPGSEGAVYGSPHLFINGAGVKGRAIFAAGKPVKKIYRTNEPVGVSYLPYNENGLVKVGGGYFEKEEMIFIPKKYLGKKLDFTATFNAFNQSTKPNEKKLLSERLYEMSWLENKGDNLKAVQAYRKYVKEAGNTSLYNALAFEDFLLNHSQKQTAFEEQQELFKKYPTAFTILGEKYPFILSETDIKKIKLPKKEFNNTGENNNYPECGIEVSKEYRFEHFKIYQSSTDKMSYIPEVYFNNADIVLSIAGFTVDQHTTEENFVKQFGGIIQYQWLDTPHVYSIPDPDAAAFVFYFKNGKIEKMEYFFYC